MSKPNLVPMEGKTLDLGAVDYVDSAVMTVEHPTTGEPTDWKIEFAGPGHPKTVNSNNAQARKTLKERKEQEQARINGRKWKGEDMSPEETREENVGWIVERALSWTPEAVLLNGERYEFTDLGKLLLDPRKAWLLAQSLNFLLADTSFTPRSEKGS